MKWLLLALLAMSACDRAPPLDPLLDPTLDAGVWREDARLISGALPRRVGTFVPIEGADTFTTTYSHGAAFGANCMYADAGKQLTVSIEAGATLLAATEGTNGGAGSARQAIKVRDWPGTLEWQEKTHVAAVRFMVARHYVVELRLVPATNSNDALHLAESIDTAPLEALSLQGVTR